MMTTKQARPARQIKAVNDSRNPTVRHIEQKYRSSYRQRSLYGKSRQCGESRVEQLLCRPICRSIFSSPAWTENVIHRGTAMDARFNAVAITHCQYSRALSSGPHPLERRHHQEADPAAGVADLKGWGGMKALPATKATSPEAYTYDLVILATW